MMLLLLTSCAGEESHWVTLQAGVEWADGALDGASVWSVFAAQDESELLQEGYLCSVTHSLEGSLAPSLCEGCEQFYAISHQLQDSDCPLLIEESDLLSSVWGMGWGPLSSEIASTPPPGSLDSAWVLGQGEEASPFGFLLMEDPSTWPEAGQAELWPAYSWELDPTISATLEAGR